MISSCSTGAGREPNHVRQIMEGVEEFYRTIGKKLPSDKEKLTRSLEPMLKTALYNIRMRENKDSHFAMVANDISRRCEETCQRFFCNLEENGLESLTDFCCLWFNGDLSFYLGLPTERPLQESIGKVMTSLYNKDIAALLESCFDPEEKERAAGFWDSGSVLRSLKEAKERGINQNGKARDRSRDNRTDER